MPFITCFNKLITQRLTHRKNIGTQLIPSMLSKLTEKHKLATSITLTERVNNINFGPKLREFLYKFILRKAN